MSKDVAIKAKEAKPKTGFFKKIARFFKDLKSEFKKIVWPTKQKTLQNTLVVLAFMLIVGVAIWCLDWVFLYIMQLVF